MEDHHDTLDLHVALAVHQRTSNFIFRIKCLVLHDTPFLHADIALRNHTTILPIIGLPNKQPKLDFDFMSVLHNLQPNCDTPNGLLLNLNSSQENFDPPSATIEIELT
jgi:hypothetical protein